MKTIIYTIILAIFLFPLDITNNEIFAHEVKEPIVPEPKIQVEETEEEKSEEFTYTYWYMNRTTPCMEVQEGMEMYGKKGFEIWDYSLNPKTAKQVITWFNKYTLNIVYTVSEPMSFEEDGTVFKRICELYTGNLSDRQYEWNKERYQALKEGKEFK